jgi:hypothetical protein
MAPVLPLLPAIGAVASAGGALYQGIAGSQAASYQAQVEKNNAAIADQNAQRAIAAGQQQTAQQSLKNAAQFGAIKTAMAANGVDVNSGSAVDLQASQRAKGQLDAETTMQKAQQEVYGYRVAATSDTAQAQLDEAQSQNDLVGGVLGAAGSLGSSSKYLGGGNAPSGPSFGLGNPWPTVPDETQWIGGT